MRIIFELKRVIRYYLGNHGKKLYDHRKERKIKVITGERERKKEEKGEKMIKGKKKEKEGERGKNAIRGK